MQIHAPRLKCYAVCILIAYCQRITNFRYVKRLLVESHIADVPRKIQRAEMGAPRILWLSDPMLAKSNAPSVELGGNKHTGVSVILNLTH